MNNYYDILNKLKTVTKEAEDNNLCELATILNVTIATLYCTLAGDMRQLKEMYKLCYELSKKQLSEVEGIVSDLEEQHDKEYYDFDTN